MRRRLGNVIAVALYAKGPDDLLAGFDDPKGVSLGFRENLVQLSQLSVDCDRNVLLKQLPHANSRLMRAQSAAT